MIDLATVTAETFEPHLGGVFTLAGADRAPVEALLSDVTRDSEGPCWPGGTRAAFRLLFEVECGGFDQGTFELHHPSLGVAEMFLVPVFGSTSTRTLFEAVFT